MWCGVWLWLCSNMVTSSGNAGGFWWSFMVPWLSISTISVERAYIEHVKKCKIQPIILLWSVLRPRGEHQKRPRQTTKSEMLDQFAQFDLKHLHNRWDCCFICLVVACCRALEKLRNDCLHALIYNSVQPLHVESLLHGPSRLNLGSSIHPYF